MPGLGLPSMQGVYDASNGVPHITLAAGQPLTIRDNATPIGDVFVLEDNGGVDFFNVDPAQMNFGQTAQRLFSWNWTANAKGGALYLPDNYTATSATSQAALQWASTFTSNIPGGAPFGNDTAPALCASVGEVIFLDQPLLLATSLLFNQATVVTMGAAFNIGPIYTMVHQPLIRVGAIGGSRSCSQMNAVRAQARIGPNTAGNLTQTSVEYFYSLLQVDATVGTVSCTTYTTLAQKAPTLTAGGTIGTLNVIDIPNIPAAGITNIYGINSAMNNGLLIRHIGTAGVELGGALSLGAGATVDWSISRAAANRADIASGDSLRLVSGGLQFVGLLGQLSSTVDGEIRWDVDKLGFNQAPTGNWGIGISINPQTITVGGDFANCLNSVGGNHTINAALSTFFQWTANAPAGTIGTGSVVDAGVMLIQTGPGVGTNRYGLLITSNPSGGTLNYAFRQSNASALARFDGRLDINRGIALGGGAAATLGTIGGSGPTVAAQAQWLEIDINGTPHWIAVWT